jgi:hypothetical protein
MARKKPPCGESSPNSARTRGSSSARRPCRLRSSQSCACSTSSASGSPVERPRAAASAIRRSTGEPPGQERQGRPAGQRGRAQPRLAQVGGDPQELGQLGLVAGVGQLQQVGRGQQAGLGQQLRVLGAGELDDPGGQAPPLGRVGRPPAGVVPRQQAGGQGDPVAGLAGGGRGLVGEPGRPGDVRAVPGQLAGQAGQHPGPQGRVGVAQGGGGLLQHRHQPMDGRGPAPRADGVQAERGPGQPAGVACPPGDLGRLEAGLPAAGQVAGPAAGQGQRTQQLGPAVLAGRRRPLQDLEGPRPVAGGLLVGEAPGGLDGGQGGVAHGRIPGAGPGLGEVVGELGRRDRAAGVALLLQRGGDPQVQAGAGPGIEPLEDRLAEQIVGEAVGPQGTVGAGQDVGQDGLAEQVVHVGDGLAGEPGEQAGADLRPHHGGRRDQLGAGRGQPGQAPLDHLADPERDPGRPGGVALGGQQPGHLLDEERVAAGPPPDGGDQPGVGLAAEHAGHHARHLLLGERPQGDDGAPGGEAGEQGHERVAGGLVEVAPGAQHQHGRGRESPGQEVEQLERRRIGPLEVVQDDQQRSFPGPGHQHGGELVEQPEPGRRGQLVSPARRVGRAGRGVGQEPGQRGGGAGQTPVLADERAEHLDPGPVGGGALTLPAPPPHDPGAANLGRGRHRRGHRRLADPGLPGEHHQPTPSGARLIDGPFELGEHVFPPDEPSPGHPVPPSSLDPRLTAAPRGYARACPTLTRRAGRARPSSAAPGAPDPHPPLSGPLLGG